MTAAAGEDRDRTGGDAPPERVSNSLGQLLVVKLEESRWTGSFERLLYRHRPGGAFLQSLRSAESTAELLAKISRTLEAPPLLWLAEEGGKDGPLGAFLPPLPSLRTAAERGPSAVARLGELIGSAMKLLGFNTNCAPTLDLASPSEQNVAARTFGSDPREVARCGEAFIHGLCRRRILACGKHFPGLGSLQPGPTARLPAVGKPMAQLWHEDLLPYRDLLPQLPLVLVSHAAYKAYDFDVPHAAAHSTNILEGLLRVKLRYEGLAVADVARAEDAQEALDPGEKAARCVKAGCNLLLVEARETSVESALAALRKAIDSGRLPAARIERSLKRIRLLRKVLTAPSGKVAKTALDQLARQFEDFSRGMNLNDCEHGRQSHNGARRQSGEPQIA